MAARRLWTFGHSTRSAAETVALLREFAVDTVVDVRTIRGSRHNPQFGADQISGWLGEAGIDYRWIENLGGRRRGQGVDPAVNGGWTHPSFHHYADYALSEDFAAGLDELGAIAGMTPPSATPVPAEPSAPEASRRVAIMCAEAVPWRCHRSLIATALVVRGWEVTHIIGPGQTIEHRIGAWGAAPVIDSDGRITYPADPALPGIQEWREK